jgi:hypothetical protein
MMVPPVLAAAPDLLAACKAVQPTFYGMLLKEWGNPDDWPKDTQGYVVYQQLRAAIAKAEGAAE